MRKHLAVSVALVLAAAIPARAETLKLAIPQKGAWDTSFSVYGERQGFFKEQGLDLDFTYTEGGATTETAVVSGSVDIAVATGTLGILSAYVKGAPVRIISAESTGSADLYFYAKADSGIKSYEPKLSSDELEVLSMMDRQDIDQLAQRLVSLVPSGLAQAQQDLRTNFGDVLAQGLRRLDLVTREEFEVQSQLLARTRAKVEALEKRIADLEAGAGT